jgi:cytochrome c peroxidase
VAVATVKQFVFLGVVALALLSACGSSSRSQLENDNPIAPNPPPPFGMEEFFAAGHQPDPKRARLGRWLFYDIRLSADRSVSCATCHRPEFAFSEPRPIAMGIGGKLGRRKTPGIINLAARTELPGTDRDPGATFFWDGRATSLEAQVLAPIADTGEMGLEHPAMVSRFSDIKGYQRYFAEAFGSGEITKERIASALADFVRTRRSGNAPYDRWSYGRDAHALSREAQHGADIFFFNGSCATCHAGFNFSDGMFHNIGIGWNPATRTFADIGRQAVTNDPRDRGAFKTPGLRDVEKRAPYMHDGSLATLRDVVEFYNRGGNAGTRNGRIRPLGLSQSDVDAVVTFLKSLSGEGYQDRPPKYFPQ